MVFIGHAVHKTTCWTGFDHLRRFEFHAHIKGLAGLLESASHGTADSLITILPLWQSSRVYTDLLPVQCDGPEDATVLALAFLLRDL
jgi:hypothetical protein